MMPDFWTDENGEKSTATEQIQTDPPFDLKCKII